MAKPEQPIWLPDSTNYKNTVPNGATPDYTYPNRGFAVALLLKDYFVRARPDKVNFLEVGVGGGIGNIICPYEPYYIASTLEQLNLPYSGLVIDRDKKVLDNFIDRTSLFYDYERYEKDELNGMSAWRYYLQSTGQSERVTHQPHPQLLFKDISPIPFSKWLAQKEALEKGVLVANTPVTFAEKLRSGQVSVLQDDVAKVNLAPYGDFDFITCMNVLYYLDEAGQKLALHNMAKNLKKGGALTFNDSKIIRPVSKSLGGWLDSAEMDDLKLSEVMRKDLGPHAGPIVVLEKAA